MPEPTQPLADRVLKWLLYFGLVAVILLMGWNQPLGYRFMSQAQIDLLEHPPSPAPVVPLPPVVVRPPLPPTPAGNWMFDPNRRTILDRPAPKF